MFQDSTNFKFCLCTLPSADQMSNLFKLMWFSPSNNKRDSSIAASCLSSILRAPQSYVTTLCQRCLVVWQLQTERDMDSSGVGSESTDLRTLDYLFEAQKVLSAKKHSTASSTELSAGREHIAAYLRWHLNNRLEQCEEAIGVTKRSSIVPRSSISSSGRGGKRKEKRRDLSELCINCNSHLSTFKLVPKKLSARKQKKKGRNSEVNLLNARCGHCKSSFQFTGLKKVTKREEAVLAPKKKNSIINNSNTNNNKNNSFNTSRSSSPTANRNSTSTKLPVSRKSSTTKTPTNASSSHKEALQRMLSDSKKQRNLDSKTRLSDFLSGCFKWTSSLPLCII